MQSKHRPDRLLPFQRKNKWVESREEQRLKQSHPIEPPVHFRNEQNSNTLMPYFDAFGEPPTSQPTIQQRKRNSLEGKRIKLKDYLHLTSLEKKNRSRNKSLTRISSQKSCSVSAVPNAVPSVATSAVHSSVLEGKEMISNQESQQVSLNDSSHSPSPEPPKPRKKLQPKPSIELDFPPQFEGLDQMEDEDATILMLEHEIEQRVAREKKKLMDLEHFFTEKFKKKANKKDTYLFMFSIYNELGLIKKVNKAIGQQVMEYGETDEEVKHATRNTDYFWAQKKPELISPAKIHHKNNSTLQSKVITRKKPGDGLITLWKVQN